MAGNSFTLTCTLRKDGVAIQAKALGDTGASGYVFLDSRFALDLCRTLGMKPKQLPRTIYPKGFDGKKGSPISQYLSFNIEIDGRRIYNLPMLIVELGSHDIIIGRNFFDYFRVLIDVHNKRLQWPPEFPPNKTYSRTVATYTRNDIRPQRIQPHYQQDMFRRDRAIARDEKRRQDGMHIRVLTCDLAKALSTAPQDSDDITYDDVNVPLDRTLDGTAKPYGMTWERQTRENLERIERELKRLYND